MALVRKSARRKVDRAELQGAWLDLAKLQGASLKFAELQGASLESASLQACKAHRLLVQACKAQTFLTQSCKVLRLMAQACMTQTFLTQACKAHRLVTQACKAQTFLTQSCKVLRLMAQACKAHRSIMRVCNVQHLLTQLWRASIIGQITGAYLSNPILTPITDHDKLIKNALEGVTDKETQEKIKNRLAMLKPDARTPQQDIEQAKFWTEQEILSLSKTDYQKQLAKLLKQLACGSEHRPYIAQGLTRASLFASSRIEATGSISLARLLLNATPATCSGAVGIDADARQSLQQTITRLEAKD